MEVTKILMGSLPPFMVPPWGYGYGLLIDAELYGHTPK